MSNLVEIIPQEQILIDQQIIYCGVDEAGAGPLCGGRWLQPQLYSIQITQFLCLMIQKIK